MILMLSFHCDKAKKIISFKQIILGLWEIFFFLFLLNGTGMDSGKTKPYSNLEIFIFCLLKNVTKLKLLILYSRMLLLSLSIVLVMSNPDINRCH